MVHLCDDRSTSTVVIEWLRNVCLVGSVDHGKTSLNTCLINGRTKISAACDEDILTGPLYNAGFTALHFKSGVKDSKTKSDVYLGNFIDTSGHVELLHEVTAAMRLVDGALIIVDPTLGFGIHNQKALGIIMRERVKPVLFINKMDKLLASKSKEDIYQILKKTIDEANEIIDTFNSGDDHMKNFSLSPSIGNVAFGSVLHGWAFTLQDMTQHFSKELKLPQDILIEKLWEDNFYDKTNKTWSTNHSENHERTFNAHILNPIMKIYDAAKSLKKKELTQLLETLNIKTHAHSFPMEGEERFNEVLSKWIPASDTIFYMVAHHMPSPCVAQKYRAESLYEGTMRDDVYSAIENCDPSAPLMMYVSKIVPAVEHGNFYAFGRVFSGKISTGQTVNIISSSHMPDVKEEIFECKIQNPSVVHGQNIKPVKEVLAGNICCLFGGNKFLVKAATISTFKNAHCLKKLHFNTPLMMRRSVEPKNPSELPKLNAGLNWLTKTDPFVECQMEESGEQTISGTGQLHLDICIKKLEEEYARIQLKKDKPIVAYRETVTCESRQASTSSPNIKSCMTMQAYPLPDMMVQDIENGSIDLLGDFRAKKAQLSEKYKFDSMDAMNIWTFGPQFNDANILVDITKGIDYIAEIKESCIKGFQWCARQGVLCEEPMRGVGFNICDAKLCTSPNDRRLGQIIPLTRQLVYASFLTGSPRLQEPVYSSEIICNTDLIDNLRQEIKKCRGTIVEEINSHINEIIVVRANIPVTDSLSFKPALFSKSREDIVSQYIFDHWQEIPGNPIEPGTDNIAYNIVSDIRHNKGLQEVLPSTSSYLKLY
ncbi:unnamed protein product [Meganyctiphanes norvegica]|uniref:Elongation factor 2 n=1 Tax=Meganyctiphanes norvegica TaxID=48144 RepID=A0AAV2QKB0_MEGNR